MYPWAHVFVVATVVSVGFSSGDLSAQAVRDSLGIAIVSTAGTVARAPSRITVATNPTLEIGGAEGDPDYTFSRVSGMTFLPDDRLMVVDWGRADVRMYDIEGHLIGRRGSAGQGPGEFQQPRMLNKVAGDTVVIADDALRRLTFLSSEDDGFRTASTLRFGPVPPSAVSQTGVALSLLRFPAMPEVDVGPIPASRAIQIADFDTGSLETIWDSPYTQVGINVPGFPGLMLAPYMTRGGVAGTPDGFVGLTPYDPSLMQYSSTGRLQRIFRVDEPPNPITDSEVRAAIARRIDGFLEDADVERSVVEAFFEGVEIPEVEPTFEAVIVDDLGWVWAQVYREGFETSHTWLLFDPEGIGHGSVSMPQELNVQAIGRDHVAGFWRDESGTWYVRVHLIHGRL